MQLGLVGYPLGHSKSPEIFSRFFKNENIEGSYKLYPLENIELIKDWLKSEDSLAGFNVTIPHKKSIIPFLDKVSKEAQDIGAVNTVKIERSGESIKLYGHNTDCLGFKQSLIDFLGDKNSNGRALVLGTGGSSNAVAYVLKELGIDYTKASRKKEADVLTYNELTADVLSTHKLIINTTPLGMSPNKETYPPINYKLLTPKHYLYDLVYNPAKTKFMLKGQEKGAKVINGESMLEIQAQSAWNIWRK